MRKILIPTLILVGVVILSYFFFFNKSNPEQEGDIYYTVNKGIFPITVTATGELDSKKSVKIRGPQGMRTANIYETTISDLIPEGTLLKAGDYVATLDRTELANKMSNTGVEIETVTTQLDQAKIDTAIELRELRDKIVNNQFTLREKQLNVELNKFEAKSIIRQTQLELERTERDYQQLVDQYALKQKQSVAKIKEILSLLRKHKLDMERLQKLSAEFTINAPSDGMLIYARTWNGKKEPGSRLSAWDPVVAELPDLTDMISKLYVNEVDISKVSKGQTVELGIDAFPDLEYTGTVIKVANIGEQVRGYDTKVFEVIVQVNEADSIMRPAMTTANHILTNEFKDVLSIPLEALHTDSLTFVYLKKGGKVIQQEVLPGLANNDAIIIEHGLEAGMEVLLSLPDRSREYDFVPIDPAIKEEIAQKLAADLKKRKQEAQKRAAMLKDVEVTQSSGNSGGGFIIIN